MADRTGRAITVVVQPEDEAVVTWLDDKVHAIKRAREVPSKEIDRSRMIWRLLRALMEAEDAAGLSSPSATGKPPAKSRKK